MTYTDLQDESIHTIFNTIISAFMYNFTTEIKASLSDLCHMTLRVYNQVLYGPLKPTPNKSHYTFNLRDISRIFQGLCNANSKLCVVPVQLLRMWIHENNRVFGDRLIDNVDRDWLEGVLVESARPHSTSSERRFSMLRGSYSATICKGSMWRHAYINRLRT